MKTSNTNPANVGELVKVTKITTQTLFQTVFSVTRAYKNGTISNPSADATSATWYFWKVSGDIIYDITNKEVFRIANRNLWVKQANQVYYVDDDGSLLKLVETCSV
jgi:hypothetical protein